MSAADARPERKGKGGRPLEPYPGSSLLPRSEWHRCPACWTCFASAEGLRGHNRFRRCPATRDPLDDQLLSGDQLRRAVHERFQRLPRGTR
jgi:hypothetical protein